MTLAPGGRTHNDSTAREKTCRSALAHQKTSGLDFDDLCVVNLAVQAGSSGFRFGRMIEIASPEFDVTPERGLASKRIYNSPDSAPCSMPDT